MGEPPEDAAITGREEIGAAAIVITLVDVVVFLPIAFMQGQVGRQLVRVRDRRRHLDADLAVRLVHDHADAGRPLGAALALEAAGASSTRSATASTRVRDWYAHRALPWALAHTAGSSLAVCAALVRRLRSRSCRSASSARSSSRRPTAAQIFIQLEVPGRDAARNVRDEAVQARGTRSTNSPTSMRKRPSAGAYAAPFGGFVVQGNVGQIDDLPERRRKHSTD